MVEPTNASARTVTGLFAVAAFIFQFLRRPNVLLVLALVALFLLSLRAWSPLTSGSYIIGQEFGVAPILLFEMDKCFDDGQFPCRWTPDLAMGYGLPVFNYFPTLPFYVGELIHLGGVEFLETVHGLYIIGFLLSALFMFLLAKEFWGNLGGLVSAVFYVYAPWHASEVYVQGDLVEHWALAFFPAILWAAYRVIKQGKPAYVLLLGLFIFALLLSHNLLVMMFFPLAVIWVLAFLIITGQPRRFIHVAIAGGIGLSLAAFYTLPVLLERDLVHLETFRTGYYNYARHFPTMDQLFLSRFWGYGPSVPGDADSMSFQIGWLHWALTAVSILIAPFLWRRSRAGFWAVLMCFVFFWASVFVMHPRSDFLWRTFTWMQWYQFPFRFLDVTIFASSFLAGAVLLLVKQRPHLGLLLSIVLIGAVIGLNGEFFRANERWPTFGQFSGVDWAHKVRTDLGVFQPDYAAALPSEPAPAKVQVIGGEADITHVEQGSASLVFTADSTRGARLQTAVTDFPNWRVRLDGKTIPHDHANALAAISFTLPAGSHSVELRLEDTALRTFANYWSLTAWALLIVSAGALVGRAGWSGYANARRRAGARARDIHTSG